MGNTQMRASGLGVLFVWALTGCSAFAAATPIPTAAPGSTPPVEAPLATASDTTAADHETVSDDVVDSLATFPLQELAIEAPEAGVLICKRKRLSGSNFLRDVCGTREQWARVDKGGELGRRAWQAILRQ